MESPPKKEFDSKKRELWGFMGPWQTPEIRTLSPLPIYQRKMARAIYTIHRSERELVPRTALTPSVSASHGGLKLLYHQITDREVARDAKTYPKATVQRLTR